MLVDASNYLYSHPGLAGLPQAEHACRAHWMSKHPFIPNASTGGNAVEAYVSHGRWVVECPDCHSAVLAPAEDLRFMCVECANQNNHGRFRPVVWPNDRESIEFLLEMRPPANQNWVPGETKDFLAKENKDHGVGGLDGKTGNRLLRA